MLPTYLAILKKSKKKHLSWNQFFRFWFTEKSDNLLSIFKWYLFGAKQHWCSLTQQTFNILYF